MHPLLASRARLLLYLTAWTPVLAFLSLVMWGAGMPWLDALVVLAPACLLDAFVCLSPWYIARVRPLRLSNLSSLGLSYTAAAGVAGLVLLGITRLIASAMEKAPPPWALLFGLGVLLYLLSVGLHYAALAMEASRDAEVRTEEARALAREAELQTLRYQLNPHFLFNSLHSISALAVQDGARAREMCIRLADFLRTSLGLGQKQSILLREELALAKSYLEVEAVRFGPRLRVDVEVAAACEECLVPPLLLQPLVENAVKHGIAGLVEGGSIRLAAAVIDGNVSITLENGFDPESRAAGNLGLGLAHVRRRLEVRYGEESRFDAGAQGEIYRVTLRFPCESPPCESPIASSSRA
ncbi:MAG TPA: histidine kinase [Bryobacteraceae bacterium]|nr:histidine kinase [Bryobacteraceae bacterium]